MIHFLDSSALVKRYVREPDRDEVIALFRSRRELAASRLAAVEIPAALARRSREGDLPLDEARRHARELRADLAELRVVELRPAVFTAASELVWKHALRAYDALQLASALRLAQGAGVAVTFWCADRSLSSAARAEGLRVRLA